MMKWKWIKPGTWMARRVDGAIATGALAVADTEPWWIAVHSIIDAAEWETIEGARMRTRDTNACIAAIGAGEGVALVRQKLIEARDLALREAAPKSAWD